MRTVALTPPEPAEQEIGVTPNQLRYLAVVVAADGQANQEQALAAADVSKRTLYRWRAHDAPFRQAEQSLWRAVLLQSAPKAMETVARLLNADTDHGPKGLAEAGRMARWVLEGAGIVAKGGAATAAAQVTVNLAPLGSFEGSTTTVDVPAWETADKPST